MYDLFVLFVAIVFLLSTFCLLFDEPKSISDFYDSNRYKFIDFHEDYRGNYSLRYYDKEKDKFFVKWISFDEFMKYSGDFYEK